MATLFEKIWKNLTENKNKLNRYKGLIIEFDSIDMYYSIKGNSEANEINLNSVNRFINDFHLKFKNSRIIINENQEIEIIIDDWKFLHGFM